ncbi:MAG: amino acid ABC transporter substrate-binding protein [Saprospiraceae bacterium]|nr:amino acid ABC transporter substrate-binding protein [Saprospiraceae bacterium]
MISARSHRQLLNGNKFLLLGIIACWSLTSCAMFQKAESDKKKTDQGDTLEPIQGRRVYDPEKGTYVVIEEALQEKMDTINWKDIPTSTYPPITSAVSEMPNDLPGEVVSVDRNTGSEFFSSYNVAILLPFLTDKMNLSSGSNSTLPENSAWALNFYSGARLALDVLNDEGVNLNVSVIDTKASEETCTALARTNTDLRNAHLIIGPYRRNNVAIMAQLAKEQDIVLVSPFTAATGVSTDNPNYIQVNPTLEAHCKTIMRHALRSYGPENIVLVSKDVPAERARLQYFHDEYKQEMNNRVTIPLREFIIRDESANFNQLNVMPFVSLGIRPSLSSPPGQTKLLSTPCSEKLNYRKALKVLS